jgi:hypothetical protein
MGRLRGHRRVLSWFGVIAILGNVLAGALCHAPASAAPQVDEVLGALTICAAGGSHSVPQDGGSDPGGKLNHCTTCPLLAGFALIVALAFAAIAFPPTLVFHRLTFGLRTLADHLSLGGIRSRAPPLSA